MEKYENEIWKPIEGYEGLYEISNYGRVYSCRRKGSKGKIVKPQKASHKKQYLRIRLSKNKTEKKLYIHRIVAIAFIPNPNNYPCINHKDEDPTNNCVENLEWCTYQYNNDYGTRNKRITETNKIVHQNKEGKTVLQYTKEGKLVAEYPSINEAERQTNIRNQRISLCCKGRAKTTGGFVWKYKN